MGEDRHRITECAGAWGKLMCVFLLADPQTRLQNLHTLVYPPQYKKLCVFLLADLEALAAAQKAVADQTQVADG